MNTEEINKSLKLVKQYQYTLAPVIRGYNNRTLYINVTDNSIQEKPVSQQM